MNFLCLSWFISFLICLVLEGTYFSADSNSIINDLTLFSTLKVGGLVPIPTFNVYFFRGVFRLLTWDYSFYEDVQVLRFFWMVMLTPGAIWGIGSTFAPVFANLLRIFR